MARTPPAKRMNNAKARANKKATPMAAMPKRRGAAKPKPKTKMPTLGGGLVGLGGTGAGGMMP